jgi:hypothetical protein
MNGPVSSGSQPHPPRRPIFQGLFSGVIASILYAASPGSSGPALAQESAKKPNILVIMGDDVGWFNIGAYHLPASIGCRRLPPPPAISTSKTSF